MCECNLLQGEHSLQVGDDMRQDALVMQLIKMMNDIWLSEELDLRMVIFRCIPFDSNKGIT